MLKHTTRLHATRMIKVDRLSDEFAKGFLLGTFFGNGYLDHETKEASLRFVQTQSKNYEDNIKDKISITLD